MNRKPKTNYLPLLLAVAVILLIAALIGALIYGGEHGWFKSSSTYNTFINQTTLEQLKLPPTGTCSISFSVNPVCSGDPVTGTARGTPNDVCNLYYSTNGGATWQVDPVSPTFHLSPAGTYSETRIAGEAGSFLFKMLCQTKCIAVASLTVRVCEAPKDCHTTCKDAGYYDGYAGTCNKPYLYEGETQVGSCCCYREAIPAGHRCYDTDFGDDPETFGTCYDEAHPTGIADYCGAPPLADNWVGENYCSYGACMGVSELCPLTTEHCVNGECVPYDGGGGGGADPNDGVNYDGWQTCSDWAYHEDKEFFVSGTQPPITNIDECEAYAQGYCSQFPEAHPNGYVTMLDFDTPDCCIWNCNWHW